MGCLRQTSLPGLRGKARLVCHSRAELALRRVFPRSPGKDVSARSAGPCRGCKSFPNPCVSVHIGVPFFCGPQLDNGKGFGLRPQEWAPAARRRPSRTDPGHGVRLLNLRTSLSGPVRRPGPTRPPQARDSTSDLQLCVFAVSSYFWLWLCRPRFIGVHL